MQHAKTVTPAIAKAPKTMESYFFSYTYTNPPAINGVTVPQSYIGSGFTKAGTYHLGQTIAIIDQTGLKQIGTYRIGNVNDKVAFNAQRNNQVTVSEYDWGSTRFIQGTGLSSNTGLNGLGSESGRLLGFGVFGSDAVFNNHAPAIVPHHF